MSIWSRSALFSGISLASPSIMSWREVIGLVMGGLLRMECAVCNLARVYRWGTARVFGLFCQVVATHLKVS